MTPRTLMSLSAAALAVPGMTLLFVPDEVAELAGLGSGAAVPLQLFAAGLLGFGALNWIGRSAIYGGIYGRPIAVANFAFGMVATGSLGSAAVDGRMPGGVWVPVVLFAAYTIAFWRLMNGPPWIEQADPPS